MRGSRIRMHSLNKGTDLYLEVLFIFSFISDSVFNVVFAIELDEGQSDTHKNASHEIKYVR